jgi:hypothetical protein
MSVHGQDYQYIAEIYKGQKLECVGKLILKPDFAPALEWARFEVIRRDPSRPLVLDVDAETISPAWHDQLGSPYLAAFNAVVPVAGSSDVAFEIPLSYCEHLVQAGAQKLVQKGSLDAGDVYQYLVCAYERQDSTDAADRGAGSPARFSVQPICRAMEADEQPMSRYLDAASEQGPNDDDPMKVFVPRRVLDETSSLLEEAGDVETGGVLIGHLRRDSPGRDVFLEVTAQIPARHAEHECTRLTFTPETWSDVDAAVALRGRNEIYVGWWHTHPTDHWCGSCASEQQEKCRSEGRRPGDFFSAHDAKLHRTVFPRAYGIALVVTAPCESEEGSPWRLYGWRQGMLSARGFHVLNQTF